MQTQKPALINLRIEPVAVGVVGVVGTYHSRTNSARAKLPRKTPAS